MAKGTELSRLRLNAHERDVVLGQTDGSQPTRLSQPLAPMGLEDMDSCACTVVFESQAVGNPYFEYLPSGRIHRSSSATLSCGASPAPGLPRHDHDYEATSTAA